MGVLDLVARQVRLDLSLWSVQTAEWNSVCLSTDHCLNESSSPVPPTSDADGAPLSKCIICFKRWFRGWEFLFTRIFKKLKLSTFVDATFLFLLFLGKKSQKR